MSYKTFEIIHGELFINDVAPVTSKTIENINKMFEPDYEPDYNFDMDLEYGSELPDFPELY